MAALQVRDIPDAVLESLERRAERHQRSLQGEVLEILSTAARQEKVLEGSPPLELNLSDARPQKSWSREEIYGDDGR